MKIKTYQLSGAGNTFSITWDDSQTALLADRPEFVRQVCLKTKTDGFIFLRYKTGSQRYFTWDFYNNDGSKAEMCGNATRCVAYYVKNILKTETPAIKLETIAGPIDIQIHEHDFEVTMTALQKFEHPKYFWCDTGVPHIVIEIPDFENFQNYKSFCKDLRFHPDFQPRGTNVTLVKLDSNPQKLKAVSYERGVEDFTQACGTGAMAAAYYNLNKRSENETFVEMPGGMLKMNLSDLQKPKMTGPAIQLGEYTYEK